MTAASRSARSPPLTGLLASAVGHVGCRKPTDNNADAPAATGIGSKMAGRPQGRFHQRLSCVRPPAATAPTLPTGGHGEVLGGHDEVLSRSGDAAGRRSPLSALLGGGTHPGNEYRPGAVGALHGLLGA